MVEAGELTEDEAGVSELHEFAKQLDYVDAVRVFLLTAAHIFSYNILKPLLGTALCSEKAKQQFLDRQAAAVEREMPMANRPPVLELPHYRAMLDAAGDTSEDADMDYEPSVVPSSGSSDAMEVPPPSPQWWVSHRARKEIALRTAAIRVSTSYGSVDPVDISDGLEGGTMAQL